MEINNQCYTECLLYFVRNVTIIKWCGEYVLHNDLIMGY